MVKGKWAIILASSLALTLGACSEEEVAEPVEVAVDEKVTEEKQEKADEVEMVDEEEDASKSTKTGKYVGKADGNTIEVETDEAFQVYHLSDEALKDVETTTPESTVTFTYYQNKEGQNVIVSLKTDKEPEVSEEKDADVSDDVVAKEWGFIGMIDGHSAEFKSDGKSFVAQYGSDQLEVINQLNENDLVSVTYNENAHGQYVLKTIQKK